LKRRQVFYVLDVLAAPNSGDYTRCLFVSSILLYLWF